MHLTCPECKNDVDLSHYPNLEAGHTLECDVCGISLQVVAIMGNEVSADILDEGK